MHDVKQFCLFFFLEEQGFILVIICVFSSSEKGEKQAEGHVYCA